MARTHGHRYTVVQLHNAGQRQCQIYRSLNGTVSRSFISKVIRKYRETGSTDDRPKSGRPRSVRTRQMLRNVRQQIRRNPARSARQMARQMNVSRSTMQRALTVDLGLKALRKSQVQMLSAADKAKRVDKCRAFLRRFTVADTNKIIFSDEKMFTVEPKLHRQNSRVYATSRADVNPAILKVRKAEFPAKIMVWGAICSSGTLDLKFIDPGTKVNKEYYINDVLRPVLLPEAQRLYPNGNWIFQQDGAPSHTANVTQDWLRQNCPDFINKQEWPARSPDLNPLDYGIWGMLEGRVNSQSHHSLAHLKTCIQREWNKIPRETIVKTVADWIPRLRRCIRSQGDHFEK